MVNQREYFEQFAELNVFALTKTFLFRGGNKDPLAANSIDLRSFLEMYFLNKYRNNDYEETNESLSSLKFQIKAYNWKTRTTKNAQMAFDLETVKRQHQVIKFNNFSVISTSKN